MSEYAQSMLAAIFNHIKLNDYTLGCSRLLNLNQNFVK